MHTMGDFSTRKLARKIKRLISILNRDTNIECCEEPTKNLFIGNAGLTTGLQRECLLSKCLEYGTVEDVVMIPDKSYCFVVFRDIDSCQKAFDDLHGKELHPNYPGVLYLAYAKSYPMIERSDWENVPPGLTVIPDFISEDEEKILLHSIDWERATLEESLKHRKVLHYGYQFQYHNNSINTDNPLDVNIPKECNILFQRLKEMGHVTNDPDQMTVNRYLPGQGIPPHIDTHSACQETILSLSLGSSIVMDFKHSDSRNISVVLPQRSMLLMSGEVRYAWRHGITPRKTDIVPSLEGGLTLQMRGIRTSFTFRWTRKDECQCNYHRECDSYKKRINTIDESDINAAELEEKHVLKVYEDIAEHFSDTRHKPWQNVLDFVLSFPTGSILIDVGCGNGKYFGHHNSIYEIGCDSSWNLSKVCKERGFQVFTCNCLAIPFKDNSADVCISIAVIHHLANKSRRMKALFEIERILRPQGKALIYVWAKNQEYDNSKSSYLKQNKHMAKLHKQRVRNANSNQSDEINEVPINENPNVPYPQNNKDLTFSLPVHTNRTQFSHTDVFVPWKLKPKSKKLNETEIQTFYRYYHVFEKEELEEMGKALKYSEIEKCFYDQGNWCIIIQKKKVT